MLLIRHTFTALAYAVIATAAAIAASSAVPGVGRELGVVIGVVALLGCALLHEASARRDAHAALADEVRDLRRSCAEVMQELTEARREAGLIREALEREPSGQAARGLARDVHNVVAEVRVLQSLVNRLSANAAPSRRRTHAVARDDSDAVDLRDLAPVARGLDDAAILDTVRDGLSRDRVELVFQPIVSLPQRKHRYFEAFSRIRADDGSVILPDQYIALAEREGLIAAIDNMLLFRCVQILRKARPGSEGAGIFCNISPHTLADRDFFEDFAEFMAENRELSRRLVFEFAQSTVESGGDDILAQLDRLAASGYRFSLDQVTNPALDLAWLAAARFRFVKMDAGVLLAHLGREGGADPRAFKRLFDRHGIDLIVEKVESEDILLELLDCQVDFGQGYLFGAPSVAGAA